MAKAPPPRTLPGDFFLLTFDRDSRDYTLVVDDDTHSSYNLGSDVDRVQCYFRTTNATELGIRAIDLSREFGAAQVIPAEDRVFQIASKPQRGTKNIFEREDDVDKTYNLPPL